MSRILTLIVIVCVLLLSPAAFCLDEHISKETLDNGLTVLTKEAHTFPIVSIDARFRTGSANEAEFSGSGISHFIEHMLFKGTKRYQDIEKTIKSYGGTINAFTSFDSTGYELTVESRYFKEALALLIDMMMNPEFSEEEFKKEKDVILKEIKLNNDDPDRRAGRLLWSTGYTVHPYRYPVIGFEDVFKRLSREDLISYHKRHYIPNNLVLGICGDINKKEALSAVGELFKNYKREPYEARTLPIEPAQITKRECSERANVNLSRLLIGYKTVPVSNDDLFPLDVLASVLGEGQSSVLHTRLVEEEKIAYTASSYNYTPKYPGIFIVSMMLDETNIPKVMKVIDEEIDLIKKSKVRPELITKAKNSTLTSFVLSHETIQSQAADMVEGEILVNNPDFGKYYVEGIKQVNASDVVRVANKYLKGNAETIVSLLPEAAEENKTALETPKKADIEIKKFTLENGMTLIVREDKSLPVVVLQAMFKGGVRVENSNNNGISNLASDMLLAGTDKKKKDEIYGSIEKLGGSISNFSGNNSFGISMVLLSEHADYGLSLISEVIQHSKIPDEELAKTKDLVLAAIKDREDDIFESGIRLFKQNLFKGSPYRFTVLGEAESVGNVDRKAVLDFYREFCVPANTVLAVFGDVDSDKIYEKVKKLFANFKGRMPLSLMADAAKIEALTADNKKVMDKEQVLVIGGFKTIKITDPDFYPFSVLTSLLSGSDGRFFYDVRDKLGISYTQGVSSMPGIDPGYFLFYIATSKENLELAKQIMAEEVKKLHNQPVTDEELLLAKADLTGGHLRQAQSNSGLSFTSCLDELYGLGCDNFKKFVPEINAVTKNDIERVVKKYFDPEKITVVTLGPLQAK